MAESQKTLSSTGTVDSNLLLAEAIAKMTEAFGKNQPSGLTAEQFAKTLENERLALNPNALTHNGVSAFSYPEGDVKRPKPKLAVTELYENGTPIHEDVLTPQEIDSYNSVINRIPKAGDRSLAWEGQLKAERAMNGQRVYINFPAKSVEDQTRANSYTIVQRNMILTDGESAANPNEVLAEVASLRKELAAFKAQHQTVSA